MSPKLTLYSIHWEGHKYHGWGTSHADAAETWAEDFDLEVLAEGIVTVDVEEPNGQTKRFRVVADYSPHYTYFNAEEIDVD